MAHTRKSRVPRQAVNLIETNIYLINWNLLFDACYRSDGFRRKLLRAVRQVQHVRGELYNFRKYSMEANYWPRTNGFVFGRVDWRRCGVRSGHLDARRSIVHDGTVGHQSVHRRHLRADRDVRARVLGLVLRVFGRRARGEVHAADGKFVVPVIWLFHR